MYTRVSKQTLKSPESHRYPSQSFNSVGEAKAAFELSFTHATPRRAFLRRLDDDDVDETAAVDGFADVRLG